MTDTTEPVKWRKATTWWDDLTIPDEVPCNPLAVAEWLQERAPSPLEHDYVLCTDGSGCSKGWGASAAVVEKIELKDGERQRATSWSLVSGTYGSTVQRREMSAFLDGVHSILTRRCLEKDLEFMMSEEDRFEIGRVGALGCLTGEERVTILWHTDRANLAAAMLFREDGKPIYARKTEKDLWLRWSAMARFVCVTPIYAARNTVAGQKIADALCARARTAMLEAKDDMAKIAEQFNDIESWDKTKPQKAQF